MAPRAGCPRRDRFASTISFRREPVGKFHLLRDKIVGKRDVEHARERPHLANRRLQRRARVGIARTTPRGCRQTLVIPETPRGTRTSPIARRMSADSSASMPAPWQAASSFSATLRCEAITGPKRRRAIVPVCAMTPGSAIVAAMYAAPPITPAAPTTAPIRSMLSTPF
jgi:hypothetical protein